MGVASTLPLGDYSIGVVSYATASIGTLGGGGKTYHQTPRQIKDAPSNPPTKTHLLHLYMLCMGHIVTVVDPIHGRIEIAMHDWLQDTKLFVVSTRLLEVVGSILFGEDSYLVTDITYTIVVAHRRLMSSDLSMLNRLG